MREAYEQWRSALAALDGTDGQAVVGELRELLAGDPASDTAGGTTGDPADDPHDPR